jgi:ferredoxin
MPRYRVTIDREACDGIFACLTRDERFVEDGDGLATFDTEEALVETGPGRIVAEFEDDRLGEAEGAAAACPPGAIDVEVLES